MHNGVVWCVRSDAGSRGHRIEDASEAAPVIPADDRPSHVALPGLEVEVDELPPRLTLLSGAVETGRCTCSVRPNVSLHCVVGRASLLCPGAIEELAPSPTFPPTTRLGKSVFSLGN